MTPHHRGDREIKQRLERAISDERRRRAPKPNPGLQSTE